MSMLTTKSIHLNEVACSARVFILLKTYAIQINNENKWDQTSSNDVSKGCRWGYLTPEHTIAISITQIYLFG